MNTSLIVIIVVAALALFAAPRIKKNLIEACVQVVGADGLIQEREAELLRAAANRLDCPIPPFVELAES